MKVSLGFAVCFFLVLLAAGGVESSRRHRDRPKEYKLLVFGDSFADAGNRQPTSAKSIMSRAWFYPYGSSDSQHHKSATGRLSDGLIQSDYIAKILGGDESPPPYRLHRRGNRIDASGVNFAVGGSGVLDSQGAARSLSRQIDQLRSLVDQGALERQDLEKSVALVAIAAGRDYYQRITHETSRSQMSSLSGQVTDEIAAAVRRLQDLGVGKVVVDLMPPLGCMPWQTVSNNYTCCDGAGNTLAAMHNSALRQKLDGDSDGVLLLDLYSAFGDIIQSRAGSDLKRKYTPCCNAADPAGGYCGQEGPGGEAQYSLCSNPDNFFFWDYMHPTQAGWEEVMDRLEVPIADFLGIQSSW